MAHLCLTGPRRRCPATGAPPFAPSAGSAAAEPARPSHGLGQETAGAQRPPRDVRGGGVEVGGDPLSLGLESYETLIASGLES